MALLCQACPTSGQSGREQALFLPTCVPHPGVESNRKLPQGGPGAVGGFRAPRVVRNDEFGRPAVALAVSKVALQARDQAWQPVACHDADGVDSSVFDQESLRTSAGSNISTAILRQPSTTADHIIADTVKPSQ
jgi:hypothetical protein